MRNNKKSVVNWGVSVTVAVCAATAIASGGLIIRAAHAEPWQTDVKNVKVNLTKTRLTFVESGKTTTITADNIVFLKKGSRFRLHGRNGTPDGYWLVGKYRFVTPEGHEYQGYGADLHVTEITLTDGTKKNMVVVFPFGNMEYHPAPDADGKRQPDGVVPGKPDHTVCITFYLVP